MEEDSEGSGFVFPRIENVLTSIRNIKTELLDYDENDYEDTNEVVEYVTYNNYPQIPNKMILGSKPTAQIVEPVAGTSSASDSWETFPCGECDIVLASQDDLDTHKTVHSLLVKRPIKIERSDSTSSTNSFTDDSISEALKRRRVVKSTAKPSNDWQEFACDECDVVVQTRSELKAHKMSHYIHVRLSENQAQSTAKPFVEESVPQTRKRQKAVKSTAKSSLLNNTFPLAKSAKVDNVRASISDDRLLCKHCDEKFPDAITLMKHTYELLPEKTFKCDICKQGFNTKLGLRGHRPVHFRKRKTSTNVSVVDCTDKAKKAKFTGKCVYCHKVVLNRRLYNMHIQKCRSAESSSNYKSSLKTVSKNGLKYKCKLCKQVFTTRYSAAEHKALKHPSYKQKNTYEIIKPVDRQSASTWKSTKPRQATSISKNLLMTDAPIPLKTLFKCNKCQIHFVTCSTALEHSKRCVLAKGDWKCSKCRYSFTNIERKIHTLQHEYSDKFIVHIVDDKILSRVLCCCPKCELHFDENAFWKHVSAGCEFARGVDCDSCNLIMHPDAASKHHKYHSKYPLSCPDFIVIEFSEAVQAKSSSRIPSRVLYHCPYCKTNANTSNYLCCIYPGACLNQLPEKQCLICGLLFSFNDYSKHILEHTEKNYTLNNYTFIRMRDNKVINPSIPEFKRCSKCKVRFINSRARDTHDCETQKYIKCPNCFHKYESSVYDIHRRFHEYRSVGESKVESNETYIYACVSCNYGFNTYDALVEHCQNHYNGSQVLKTSLCNFCKLNVTEEHNVNHSNVKVLNFNHDKLLNADFLMGFKTIPEEHANCILCKSMYGSMSSMRHVRLHLEVDGPAELSLYRCGQCTLCFDKDDVSKHTQQPCQNSRRYRCYVCSSEFPTRSTAVNHKNIHRSRFRDDIIFRIIIFNKQSDSKLIEALRTGSKIESLKFRKCHYCEVLINKNEYQNHMESHEKIKAVETPSLIYTIFPSDEPEKMYTAYRCVHCKADLMKKRNIKRHKCKTKFTSIRCKKCSLSIRSFMKNKHEQFHLNVPKYVPNNIRVLEFELQHDGRNHKVANDMLVVKPKNKRKTHDKRKPWNRSDALSESDEEDLLKSDDDNESVIDETPTKDQAANELIRWKCEYRRKLFQCKICYMCFVKKCLLLEHLPHCNNTSETPFTCDRCNITFHPSLVVFNDKLHDLSTSKADNNYIYLISASLASNTDTWLYRCESCDVHYLSFPALLHHFNQNHRSATSYVECEICNLKFSLYTYTKHMSLHENHVGTDNLFNIESVERKYVEFIPMAVSVNNDISSVDAAIDEDYEDKSQTTDVTMDDEQSTNLSVHKKDEAANSIEDENSSYVLYKCISCSVHYINKKTLISHMRRKLRIHQTDSIKCDICNIEFGLITMKKHKIMHHQNNKRSNFIINTITDNVFYDDLFEVDEVSDESFQSESENESEQDDNEYKNDAQKSKTSFVIPDELAASTIENDANKMNRIKLYQCKDCRICVEKSQRQFHVCCSDIQKKQCIQCCLAFRRNDISEHIRLHRKYPELSRKNYVLVKFGQRSTKSKIYKCVTCSTHFVSIQTLQWHIDVDNHKTKRDCCEFCGLFFGKLSLSRHVYIHHTKLKLSTDKFDIVHVLTDKNSVAVEHKSTETNILPNASDAVLPKGGKKLYKCFECDVYFLTQTGYYKHMYNHAELDPTDFIACKMCDMQFLTEEVGVHMKTHRDKTFSLNNLMIEGYQPGNGSPRIESYLAVEGLTSKLVTTTTPFDNDEDGIKIEQLSTVDSTNTKLQ